MEKTSQKVKPDDSGRTFRVLYCNAASLLNKLDELSTIVCDCKPDFVAVCETWSNKSLTDSFFNLPGYSLITRIDREDTTEGIGGGLITYARSDLAQNVSEVCDPNLDGFHQITAIRIGLKGQPEITLALLYRPHHIYENKVPLANRTAENNDLLAGLVQHIPKPFVAVGDLNYSNINWHTLSTTDHGANNFLSAVKDNFLTQHIDFSTHNTGTQPDVVLASNNDIVLDVEEMCHLGSSDHSMVMVTVKGGVSRNVTYEKVPDWRKADLSLLHDLVKKVDWSMEGLGALDSWSYVKENILLAEDRCVPRKRRRVGSRPLWMQQNVMRTIRKKKRLWATYKRTNDYAEYLAYKNVQSETRKLVRQAKRKFEKKLASEAKKRPKMFYSYLRSKTANRSSVGPLKEKDEIVSDDTGMANLLNKFFVSVFTIERPDLPELISSDVAEKLTDVNFPVDSISGKIHKLKSTAAFGPDRIGPRILQETSDILCGPLSVVFRRSLEEGVVPEDWKRGNITPIFKSGSKMTPGNYRPVSLTCIVCKLMESIIRDNIVSHLNRYALIHSSQHGFTAGRSCQTNLIEYLDTLTKLVDEGHSIDVVYLDFAKAFDKVPHQRLLLKLEGLGIGGKVLVWIKCWLSDRKQRVVLNGKASEWLSVTSGVPQGSVLGPTLFVIFINDLDDVVDVVDGFISKFADDTKYGRVVHSEEDHAKMQRDIDQLLEWADKWQMEFNAKKCKIMHFGPKNPQFSYCMGGYAPAGTVLEDVSSEKDLGVIVSDSLKPSSQCTAATKKANSILGQMRRAFQYRDKLVWTRLYMTYVRHHLEVAVQSWSPWYAKDINLLEQVQKRAVNMVTGLKAKTYEDKLIELGLTSLEERRKRGDIIQMWKYVHEGSHLVRLASGQHARLSRHTAKPLNICRVEANKDVRKNFFTVRAVVLWNNLPHVIQAEEDLKEFKRLLDWHHSIVGSFD